MMNIALYGDKLTNSLILYIILIILQYKLKLI